jgi:signal transduction histidine kinase
MNDHSASAVRPDTRFGGNNVPRLNARSSDSQADGRLDLFQHASSDLADHLRLWPVWLRGQELGMENGRQDECMAVFSHELRNSLGAVRSAAWILRKETPGGPAAVKARELIERQVAQMARLVDDLLDVSRIRRGRLILHRERVDLCAIAADAARTVGFIMQERNHHLITSLPDAPVWVHADAARLEQVIVNLLLNAAKYTDPGGRIELEAVRETSEAIVRVRDDGIGIESHALPLVFNLFAQVNPLSKGAKTGLGIGLALVRNLVEHHGGQVKAASAGLGRGSEFTIRLPTLPE